MVDFSFSVVALPCKCKKCRFIGKTFPEAVNTSLVQDSLGGSELCFIGWLHGRADNRFREFFTRSKTQGLFLRARYVHLSDFN